MTDEGQEPPRPPRAPEIVRKFKLYRHQWVGIPLMMSIPVLALLGVFGESWDTARAASAQLEIELRYPTRFRYKQLNEMDVYVTNTSAQRLDTVTVAFDTMYTSRFSTVTFLPDASEAYAVELLAIEPGERRLIRVELQAERYWRHTGDVAAWAIGGDTARIPVSTIIFP